MRIVHIITSMNKGGAETTLFKILKFSKQSNSKEEHVVISFSKLNYFEDQIKKLNVPFFKIDFKLKFIFFIYFLKLFKIIKKTNPDVIQCWMYHPCFLGGLAAKFLNIKNIIWNIRHSNYKFNKTKLSTIIVIRICSLLSRIVPNKIIYCSNSSYEFHSKNGYYSKNKNIIYNGYDSEYFSKKQNLKLYSYQNNVVKFGFIGRYSPQKNLFMYLDAINNFVKKYPSNSNFKVLMYGKNVDNKNKELLEKINQYNLSKFVELKGYKEDVREALQNIDYLGLSSSYGESFPNVLAEAMLSGIPCFATDLGESKNIISEYGKVVSINDSQEFSKAMNEYYNIYQKVNIYYKLSNSCRKHIKDNYSIESMVRKYQNLWALNNE